MTLYIVAETQNKTQLADCACVWGSDHQYDCKQRCRKAANLDNAAMTHNAGNFNLVDEDLHFVARMLGDAAALGPAAAAASARRAAHKRDRAAWASSQEAQPSDHDQALLARHNTPSSRSNSKLYHCEACDCPVGAHERDWAVHISGVKHKRQLVSLLHTGQLGNNIVSLFEAEPGIGNTACALQPLLFAVMSSIIDTDALAVTSQQQQAATWMKQFRRDYSCDMPKLKKARTEVMKVCVSCMYQLHVLRTSWLRSCT